MTTRIRGRTLQRIRRAWFTEHPLCAECERNGRVSLAVELDHIIALTNGGKDFDQDDGKNRQGLCKECHEKKTAADLGHKPTGCDINGFPTDPRHHWNAG
jgi:5-methylcytosine-specific restriction protein A